MGSHEPHLSVNSHLFLNSFETMKILFYSLVFFVSVNSLENNTVVSLSKEFNVYDKSFENIHPQLNLFTEIDNYDVKMYDYCQSLLRLFANESSKFIHCAVNYSRPVRMCQFCAQSYFATYFAYNKILSDEDGNKCSEVILNADKIQITNHIYGQISGLWTTSFCDNCYDMQKLNESNYPEPSEDTLKFDELIRETLLCMEKASNSSNCTESNCTIVCKTCHSLYKNLTSYFESLVKKNDGMENICLDIVDTMNITRSQWSKEYKCVQYNNETFVLFTVIVFVSTFPLFFYWGSYCQSDKKQTVLKPQKRLASARSNQQFSLSNTL